MKVVIIKYNAGNIKSVENALMRLGVNAVISSNFDEIRSADKVIFPGVGEASSTMAHLKQTGLDKLIPSLVQPVLGVCLGLQLMCKSSEENNTECLGIFSEVVKRFDAKQGFKVPHMGWNNLNTTKGDLFKGISTSDYVYFVHSYYASCGKHTVAKCNYTVDFSASLQKDNFYATQFHPEKSGEVGALLLKNFIEL